jgi:hypothetical protein
MRRTEIQLSEPFEKVLASVLTLPSTPAETKEAGCAGADVTLRESLKGNAEVIEALRSLYEAANGQQVETRIGFVPIAPPIAGFLKAKPYYATTQYEFFLEAFTRILAGDSRRKFETNGACTSRSKSVISRAEIDVPRSHARKENRSVLVRSTSPRFTSNQRMMHP